MIQTTQALAIDEDRQSIYRSPAHGKGIGSRDFISKSNKSLAQFQDLVDSREENTRLSKEKSDQNDAVLTMYSLTSLAAFPSTSTPTNVVHIRQTYRNGFLGNITT